MAGSQKSLRVKSSPTTQRRVRNLIVFVLLYSIGLAAVWGLSLIRVSTLVIFPVFILGVLIASLETDSGVLGAALGVAYLLSYDLFFTTPVFELKILSRTDIIALSLFMAVALIMGVITHRMNRQVQSAERINLALGQLNSFSTDLLDSSTPKEACLISQEFLSKVLKRHVAIDLGAPGADKPKAQQECYELRCPTGYGEPTYRDETKRYLPLGMKGRIMGVVTIDCSSGPLDSSSSSLINAIVAQTLVAIERNQLENEKES